MTEFQLYAVEDAGPRSLPVAQGAAQFADLYRELPLGVYDALRTFEHNKFLRLGRHLARTERSMALLNWSYYLDRARLLRTLHAVVTACEWPEMRVRIDVLAEPAAALGTTSRELIALQPFSPPPAELYERGVAVDFAAGLSRPQPRAKTADFAAQRPATAGLQQLESAAAGDAPPQTEGAAPYEYLLVDAGGRILEGTGTNFWAIHGDTVFTAAKGVLEGITREILLDLIPQLGIKVQMETVAVEDIPELDEAALSGSSRAFLAVVSIAGQAVGDGRPGPLTRRILDAYNAFVAENVKPAL